MDTIKLNRLKLQSSNLHWSCFSYMPCSIFNTEFVVAPWLGFLFEKVWKIFSSDKLQFLIITAEVGELFQGQGFLCFCCQVKNLSSEIQRQEIIYTKVLAPTNHPWKEKKMIWTKPPWGHGTQPLIFRGVGQQPTKTQKQKTGWWLNQPIWKICLSNWIIYPGIRVKIPKKFELPPPRCQWKSLVLVISQMPRALPWAFEITTLHEILTMWRSLARESPHPAKQKNTCPYIMILKKKDLSINRLSFYIPKIQQPTLHHPFTSGSFNFHQIFLYMSWPFFLGSLSGSPKNGASFSANKNSHFKKKYTKSSHRAAVALGEIWSSTFSSPLWIWTSVVPKNPLEVCPSGPWKINASSEQAFHREPL